jgi:hypothetical protein
MRCIAQAGPETGHAHDHDPAHGSLVHRFEHAEQWVPESDDPARDAWHAAKFRSGLKVGGKAFVVDSSSTRSIGPHRITVS